MKRIIDSPKDALTAAISAFILAILFIVLKYVGYFNTYYILGVSCPLFILGLLNSLDVMKINNNLKRIRTPRLITYKRDKIPEKDGYIYFGEGFNWIKEHAEKWNQYKKIDERKIICKNETLGGYPLMQAIGYKEEGPVFLPEGELNKHTLVIASTGAGKTRALEVQVLQAIKRMVKDGQCAIIIDPKGDKDLRNFIYNQLRCEGQKYLEKFKFFSLPHQKFSCKYNPLSNYSKPSDIADRIAPLLGGEGGNDVFVNYCHGVINDICQLMDFLGRKITLKAIDDYAFENQFGLLRIAMNEVIGIPLDKLSSDEAVQSAALSYQNSVNLGKAEKIEQVVKYISLATRERDNYGKMTNSLKPLMSQLARGEIGDLLSPKPEDEDVLDWGEVIEKGQIVLMDMGSLMSEMTGRTIGKLTLLDLRAKIGELYAYENSGKYTPINLYIDELTMIIVKELVSLLNQGRGAGLRVMAFTQSSADIEAGLGNAAIAEQVFENCNTKICLRLKTEKSAELFSKECGTKMIKVIKRSMGYRPAFGQLGNALVSAFGPSFNISEDEEEKPLVDVDAVKYLPVGQAFMNCNTLTYKMVFPLIQPDDDDVDALEKMGADKNYLDDTETRYREAIDKWKSKEVA